MYDSIDLAVIFRNCNSIDDVANCCKVFVYLKTNWGFDRHDDVVEMGRARLKTFGYEF